MVRHYVKKCGGILAILVTGFLGGMMFQKWQYDMNSVQEIRDLNYNNSQNAFHSLDIYTQKGIMSRETPVLVNIHGGSLYMYDKSLDEKWCEWMADNYEIKVINMNYTLLPYGEVRDLVVDLNNCISWIKNNAEEYGFSDEIIVCGESAGGYIAGLHAACINDKSFRDKICVKNIEAVSAYILDCPMTSLDILQDVTEINEECNRSVAGVIEDGAWTEIADLTKLNYGNCRILLIDTLYDGLYYDQHELSLHLMGNENFIYKECEKIENDLFHVFNYRDLALVESKEINEFIADYILTTSRN